MRSPTRRGAARASSARSLPWLSRRTNSPHGRGIVDSRAPYPRYPCPQLANGSARSAPIPSPPFREVSRVRSWVRGEIAGLVRGRSRVVCPRLCGRRRSRRPAKPCSLPSRQWVEDFDDLAFEATQIIADVAVLRKRERAKPARSTPPNSATGSLCANLLAVCSRFNRHAIMDRRRNGIRLGGDECIAQQRLLERSIPRAAPRLPEAGECHDASVLRSEQMRLLCAFGAGELIEAINRDETAAPLGERLREDAFLQDRFNAGVEQSEPGLDIR